MKGCATCQQNKNLVHRIKASLYRIPVPTRPEPFKHIALDLITELPKSRGFDAILTIVDHGCSRAAIFLPCHTTITGPQIAELYLNHVYRWFGIPHKVISDRDPRFTSHFGRALRKELGIQQNISTAFHPQTDGLMERKNQWVEQYLRLVTSNQEDWSKWLAMATIIHNNSKNATTQFSPSQLLIGLDPDLTREQTLSGNNFLAEQQASLLKQWRQLAAQALNRTADATGIPETRWKVGQQVWLEAKNLPLSHGTIKLAPRRHGPFKITKIVSPVAYQLSLPHQWNIHPVFHANLLTPFVETDSHSPNFSKPPPDLINDEEQYEVEAIRSHRRHGRKKQLQYLLKWKGYPESDNTWEPVDMIHAPDLVKQYERRHSRELIRVANDAMSSPIPPSWSSRSLPSFAHTPTQRIDSRSSSPIAAFTSRTSTPSNTPTFAEIDTEPYITERWRSSSPTRLTKPTSSNPSTPISSKPFVSLRHPTCRMPDQPTSLTSPQLARLPCLPRRPPYLLSPSPPVLNDLYPLRRHLTSSPPSPTSTPPSAPSPTDSSHLLTTGTSSTISRTKSWSARMNSRPKNSPASPTCSPPSWTIPSSPRASPRPLDGSRLSSPSKLGSRAPPSGSNNVRTGGLSSYQERTTKKLRTSSSSTHPPPISTTPPSRPSPRGSSTSSTAPRPRTTRFVRPSPTWTNGRPSQRSSATAPSTINAATSRTSSTILVPSSVCVRIDNRPVATVSKQPASLTKLVIWRDAPSPVRSSAVAVAPARAPFVSPSQESRSRPEGGVVAHYADKYFGSVPEAEKGKSYREPSGCPF